jgi:hypothetical protein
MKLTDRLEGLILNSFQDAYSITACALCSFGTGKLIYDVYTSTNRLDGMAEVITGGAIYLIFQKMNEEIVIPFREKRNNLENNHSI